MRKILEQTLSGVTVGRDAQGATKKTRRWEGRDGQADARRNAGRRDADSSREETRGAKKSAKARNEPTKLFEAHGVSSRGRRRRDDRRERRADAKSRPDARELPCAVTVGVVAGRTLDSMRRFEQDLPPRQI